MVIAQWSILVATMLLGCTGPKVKRGETVDTCRRSIEKLLQKDFATWEGLATTCDLASVGQVLDLADAPTRGLVGDEGHVANYRVAKTASYDEPLAVWYRDGNVVKIQVKYPSLPDPQALLKQLGQPDAQLDYYLPSIPRLNKGGEWVYAARGLTLFLSSDRKSIVELAVYPATTAERYRKDIYHLGDPPEEFPRR